ncbi:MULTISPECIES: AAA family ATPase [Pseudomonas]|uniref:ATP-binding protein n=1 Tax=Pseudomonas glycinae TaxID=1785145 RepID=A0ABN4MS19_9PSED|nr:MULTISPECIES: AAA family ATPase [Pseudomonas]AMQ84968.1 ATP-binding protein [Pseudomonas glycinae]MBL0796834.1 AAA family ATPase [Pseudomonas sp. B7]NKF27718.1 AAA family ATPase [Pseudomonas sp. BG5]
MKLRKLKLKDFRRFEDIEIDFHPELTVIAARNGQGKTTILEAIATALGPFVGAFDMGKSKHIERTDARYVRLGNSFENEQRFPVIIDAVLDDPAIQWQRALHGPKSRTTTKEATSLANWGKNLQELARTKAATALPLISYYPAGRLWITHNNSSRKAVVSASRTMGYEDCLSSASNFVQMQQWMRKATMALLQQQELPGYEQSDLKPRITGIQNAVNLVLENEGWSNFHYSLGYEDLAMSHPDHGLLPISLLSDGVRAMISLTADMAFRCARLNGQFEDQAPLLTEGIVLIDEVDLHLHPAWQQQVLAALRKAFPKIQFIVSTHSPQVLTTANREQIRVIHKDEQGWVSEQPAMSPLAQESGDALAGVMNVNTRPPMAIVETAHAYEQLFRDGAGNSPKATQLKQELDNAGYEISEADMTLWTFLAAQVRKTRND